MSMSPLASTSGSKRRLVLVDFDWQDADLVPELLKQPGISIRLVAGSTPEDAGVRLAELCGLPRTTDLTDLTREIFDLALVSERSPRRDHVRDLLAALGTPSSTPQSFVWNEGGARPLEEADWADAGDAALRAALLHADLDALVEEALPDLSLEERASEDGSPPAAPSRVIADAIPSLDDRERLEALLSRLCFETGAHGAEIHLGPEVCIAQSGTEDRLLATLVERVREHGTPQVFGSLVHPSAVWGAWPFRTARHRGVIAVASICPEERWTLWQCAVDELRAGWELEERERTGPAFPLVPGPRLGWLEAADLSPRLDLAVERNRRDGLRFTLYRLEFPQNRDAIELLARRLPRQLRDTDCICRPRPHEVLLLVAAGADDRSSHLRERLLTLWREAWGETGAVSPAAAISERQLELTNAAEAGEFLARARQWLEGGP